MGVGVGAARMDDRVALAQAEVEQGARAGRALVVADRDPAVERVDQLSVPLRCVDVARVLAEGREHREGVDEAVDRAALPAHDVVDDAAVGELGGGEVNGPRAIGGERLELPTGAAVEVVDHGVGGAVKAPAGGAPVGVQDPEAEAVLVVHDRLAQPGLDRLADERILMGPGEIGPSVG